MRRVRAPDAWATSRGDASAVIAIVDTGVDPNHPDLRGRVMRGWDFQNDDGNMISSTQRVRIAVAHGRLDAARALRPAAAAAEETEPETDSSSGSDPTPDPTPTTETHDWRGILHATDTWDRNVLHVRGDVHVHVRWSGVGQLVMWVQDPDGDVIKRREGQTIDFRIDLPAGDYTFTVQQTSDKDVTYRVIITSSG